MFPSTLSLERWGANEDPDVTIKSQNSVLQVTQTQSHPRQFVSENKSSLMAWDDYSWKQLFTRVDALREAWEQRVAGIKAAANQGADPTSIESLRRDAESHVGKSHFLPLHLFWSRKFVSEHLQAIAISCIDFDN